MKEVMEAVLNGAGQILRLEGEAGQGKRHLAAEFAGQAIARGFRVAIGVCQSTGQTVPYYPWRQVLRALLELSDEPAGGEDQLAWIAREIAQVEAIVDQTNPDWFPRLPLLGDLLGLPIPDTPTSAAFDPSTPASAHCPDRRDDTGLGTGTAYAATVRRYALDRRILAGADPGLGPEHRPVTRPLVPGSPSPNPHGSGAAA